MFKLSDWWNSQIARQKQQWNEFTNFYTKSVPNFFTDLYDRLTGKSTNESNEAQTQATNETNKDIQESVNETNKEIQDSINTSNEAINTATNNANKEIQDSINQTNQANVEATNLSNKEIAEATSLVSLVDSIVNCNISFIGRLLH